MVNCNNQCGWLQLSMRLDNSKMSLCFEFVVGWQKQVGLNARAPLLIPIAGYRLPGIPRPIRMRYVRISFHVPYAKFHAILHMSRCH